jgi:transcriptional repressor NrdR
MRCPFCHSIDHKHGVKDSRSHTETDAIRRRRECKNPECGLRFTTYERIHLRDLIVLKKAGVREPFDRDKLTRSMEIALRKRPVSSDRIEQTVNQMQRLLENHPESEVPTKVIGKMVMEHLAELDQVAFVRFASVYRDFREAGDFEDFLGSLNG